MQQGAYFGGLSNWLSALSVIMSGAVVWYGGVWLHRRKRLGFSFLLVIFLIIGLLMLSGSRMYDAVSADPLRPGRDAGHRLPGDDRVGS